MTGAPVSAVAVPTSQLNATEPDNVYAFRASRRGYVCTFNNRTWNTDMPEGYFYLDRPWEIRRSDPCTGVADQGKVLATGSLLYEYLQKERLSQSSHPRASIEIDASTVFQDRHVFYFECANEEIVQLYQCPSGTVFRHGECQPVSVCLNQLDGTIFPDPFDREFYYECRHSKLERKQCSRDTFFEHNGCKETNVQHYCQHNAFQMLDEKTLLVCRNGRATFETCPPGWRYFENDPEPPVCERDWCVGAANDQKRPLPMKIEHGLAYSPGFARCHNERVQEIVTCPREWDFHDHQLPLPQVFDMKLQACTAPVFCENVDPQNPDTIVPVREWTRHAPQWKYAALMDQVTGYKCESGTRIGTPVPPGHRINQLMRMESACLDNTITVVPISDEAGKYYDCATQSVKVCGYREFFNGKKCQYRSPFAFHIDDLKGRDLFKINPRTNPLDKDLWIKSWNPAYVTGTLKRNCTGDYIYNELYHTCIHKDCVKFPFLSQIEFSIGLRDGSTCTYDDSRKYIDKIAPTNDEKYGYWSQRMSVDSVDNEPCQEGQHIQSGHIVFDRIIFATCNPEQPFVFCPSPLTTGIEKVNGIFTCNSNKSLGTRTMQPLEKRTFFKNELFKITSVVDTDVKVKNQLIRLQANVPFYLTSYNSDRHFSVFSIEATNHEITIYYKARVSHPPHVVRKYADNGDFIELTSGPDGTGYTVQTSTFTTTHLNFPKYTFVPILPDLEL